MSNLIKTIERLDREAFFRRVDAAQPWGKSRGFDYLRGTVHPDHCPNPAIKTAPPTWHFRIGVLRLVPYAHVDYIWYGNFRRDAERLLARYKLEYPLDKFRMVEYLKTSKQASASLPEAQAEHHANLHLPSEFRHDKPKPRKVYYVGTLPKLERVQEPVYGPEYYNPIRVPVMRQPEAMVQSESTSSTRPEPRFYLWPSRVPVW